MTNAFVILLILLFVFMVCFYVYTYRVESFEMNSLETILSDLSLYNIPYGEQQQPIPFVDCIYCITMDDRKGYIKDIFENYGLYNVKMVKACSPADLSSHDYEKYSDCLNPTSAIFNLMTKLPVHLSYLSCLYHALQNNYSTIIIFEDDIFFTQPISTLKDSILEFIKHDLEGILYLGYCHLKCDTNVNIVSDSIAKLPNDSYVLCKHGIVHNMNYVEKFFQHHGKLNLRSDIYFNNFYRDYKVPRYVVRKPFVFQNRENIKSHNENPQKLLSVCNF